MNDKERMFIILAWCPGSYLQTWEADGGDLYRVALYHVDNNTRLMHGTWDFWYKTKSEAYDAALAALHNMAKTAIREIIGSESGV